MVLDLIVWVKKLGVWSKTEETINLTFMAIARYRKVTIQVGKKQVECTRILFVDGDVIYMAGDHKENKKVLDDAVAQMQDIEAPKIGLSAN